MSKFIHPTAILDNNPIIGDNTKIWHWSHISKNVFIGENCVLGQNTFIGENVKIGNGVKIQNNVSVFNGVEIQDDVFIGPSVVFTNIKTPEEIYHKLKSYLHHIEFELEPLTIQQITDIMNEKRAIYNLNVDQRTKKFGKGEKLLKYDFQKLPDYIKSNKSKYERWLD